MIKNRIYYAVFILIFILSNEHAIKAAERNAINREQMYLLPGGRCTGSILENWIPYAVFFQVETGGLSRVDLPRFSPRGISWIEQNFLINGIDITDPFRSGYPLFEPAWESISGMEIKSSRENDPHETGLDWELDIPENTFYQASYNIIFPIYNTPLIPEGIMDREPSFPYGSPHERRKYVFSNEMNVSYNLGCKFYLNAEALNTWREFPTLLDESGDMIREKAGKYTITGIYAGNNPAMPYTLLFISQYTSNNNYGANLRLDNNDTLTQYNLADHIQYNANKKLGIGEIDLLSGLTAKFEDLDPHLESPAVTEFDTESGPVPDAGEIFRLNFDNKLNYKYDLLNIEAGFQFNGVNYKPDIPYSQTMNSYNGDIFSVTVWDKTETCKEYVYNTKLKTGLAKNWGSFSLSGNIYADNAYAAANGEKLLNWYGLGGNILSGYTIKKSGTIFNAGALHQPAKINSYITAFLDTGRPSGKTYADWIDMNGNNLADDSELAGAELVSSTGGKYHHKDRDLKRPYQDELSLSVEQGIGENLTIVLQGSHRIFSDYFIVNYEKYDGAYTETSDGFRIYNKQAGEDEYYLSNYSGDSTHYSGVEARLLWESGKIYADFMCTAFMVRGFAPVGNGPDCNDYAVISEETASPNSRINSSGGRLSSDRAYMANILFAYKIRKDLSLGITMKYRDGEPFSQYRIYYDTNGMPVRIMDQQRGNWFGVGTGRYTFAWNMDIRLRYTPVIFNTDIAVTLDIYNVLGSSTEIIESIRIEDERLALEAVPGRTVKLGIDMRF